MKEMNAPMLGDLLIVDDNQQNLSLLSKVLKDKGHKVRVATDGRMALQVIQARAPELILLDLKMPEIDGYEVMEHLKADPNHVQIPVIVISILSDEEEIVRAFKTGCVDYVTKPFRNEEVLTRVDTHLRLNRYQKALETAKEELEERVQQRTQELQRSEEKYRTLSANVPGMIYRARSDWSTEVISNCETVCGYSTDEFNTQAVSWLDLIHPDDRLRVSQEGDKLIEKPGSLVQEYRILAKDGSVRWVSDHKTSFFSEDGTFVGVDGIVIDVTERKLAEDALRKEKALSDAIIKNLPGLFYMFDEQGYCVRWNEKQREYAGLSDEEMPSKLFLTGTQEDDIDAVQQAFQDVLTHGYAEVEHRAIHQTSGEPVTYLANGVRVEFDGAPYVLGMAVDITERKKAEEALRANEERLALTQEAASMGMFDWDIIHDQAVCNERYFRIFGLEPQERMLSEEEWLGMVHPDDRRRAQREVRSTLEDRAPYNTEYRIVWSDNSVKWINSRARVFRDENGIPQRMIGAVTDITERKKVEQALREQLDELRRWHEVTLNREDRAQELKSEVNALLTRLGEPSRYANMDGVDGEVYRG